MNTTPHSQNLGQWPADILWKGQIQYIIYIYLKNKKTHTQDSHLFPLDCCTYLLTKYYDIIIIMMKLAKNQKVQL